METCFIAIDNMYKAFPNLIISHLPPFLPFLNK